jgi:hypothetical protein
MYKFFCFKFKIKTKAVVVFSHVTCFPPSNLSKSKNKNVYIIIANGYTTKQHLEVSQSSYLTAPPKRPNLEIRIDEKQ